MPLHDLPQHAFLIGRDPQFPFQLFDRMNALHEYPFPFAMKFAFVSPCRGMAETPLHGDFFKPPE
jgi:hypothetical protein